MEIMLGPCHDHTVDDRQYKKKKSDDDDDDPNNSNRNNSNKKKTIMTVKINMTYKVPVLETFRAVPTSAMVRRRGGDRLSEKPVQDAPTHFLILKVISDADLSRHLDFAGLLLRNLT